MARPMHGYVRVKSEAVIMSNTMRREREEGMEA
jgi:hypothetical protein